MERHVAVIHEGQKLQVSKEYKCNICNGGFTSEMKLNKHIAAVHEDKKPYKCTNFNFSFAFKESLNKHYDVIHERKKQFKCSRCPVSFSCTWSLNRHNFIVHEGKKPKVSVVPDIVRLYGQKGTTELEESD